MGRDDARAVGGLEGGRAPARAWAAFMRIAVAGRPVENFATEVTFPERLEGEEPLLGEEEETLLVDEFGMPIESQPIVEDPNLTPGPAPEPLDENFIDRAIGRREPPPAEQDEGLEPPQ